MGLIIFFVFLKLLAWFASSIIAGQDYGHAVDITGELSEGRLVADQGGFLSTVTASPFAYLAMARDLVVWNELVFSQLGFYSRLVGHVLGVMAGWAVFAEFRADMANMLGRGAGFARRVIGSRIGF